MTDQVNTMMQEMKAGFRRMELIQQKFEENKRKNIDGYFQKVLNNKKQRFFEELGWQQEVLGRVATVKQVTDRV